MFPRAPIDCNDGWKTTETETATPTEILGAHQTTHLNVVPTERMRHLGTLEIRDQEEALEAIPEAIPEVIHVHQEAALLAQVEVEDDES